MTFRSAKISFSALLAALGFIGLSSPATAQDSCDLMALAGDTPVHIIGARTGSLQSIELLHAQAAEEPPAEIMEAMFGFSEDPSVSFPANAPAAFDGYLQSSQSTSARSTGSEFS